MSTFSLHFQHFFDFSKHFFTVIEKYIALKNYIKNKNLKNLPTKSQRVLNRYSVIYSSWRLVNMLKYPGRQTKIFVHTRADNTSFPALQDVFVSNSHISANVKYFTFETITFMVPFGQLSWPSKLSLLHPIW